MFFVEEQHERSEQETAVFLEDVVQSVPEGNASTTDLGVHLGGEATGEVEEGVNEDGATCGGPRPLTNT